MGLHTPQISRTEASPIDQIELFDHLTFRKQMTDVKLNF